MEKNGRRLSDLQIERLNNRLVDGRISLEEFVRDASMGQSSVDRLRYAQKLYMQRPDYNPAAEIPIKKFGITIPGINRVDMKIIKQDVDRKVLAGAAKSGDVAALQEAINIADDPTLADNDGKTIIDHTKDNPEAHYIAKQTVYAHRRSMGPAEGQDPAVFQQEQAELLESIRQGHRDRTIEENPDLAQTQEQDRGPQVSQDMGDDVGPAH